MIKFNKKELLSKKEEIIKQCKENNACKPEYKRLLEAKDDNTFYEVLLMNLRWLIQKKITNCPTEIKVPNSVTKMGVMSFRTCNGIVSIYIPKSVKYIDEFSFGCINTLKTINIAKNNPNYASIDGVLYDKDIKTLIKCPEAKTSVTIPNSVTTIKEEAFEYCTNLTSVTIPNSVTSIGDNAFHSCIGLTSITIGNSVTLIRSYAFNGCSGLTSITIGNSVKSIGDGAFYNCSNLTSITIPKSVKSIGEKAFIFCKNLKSITLHKNCQYKTDSFSKRCQIIIKN